MVKSRFIRQSVLALSLLLIATVVFAQPQQGSEEFTPKVGQEGKDVIWVPTSQELVNRMLDIAKVTAQDFVIDLGSGDGRMVITAAKRGARALGIEYNPDMVELSKRNAAKEGVSDKAQFIKADLFASDFTQATVITMFLMPDINLQLRPQILNLKPGTRIVSNTFTMGDWTPDDTVTVEEGEKCTMYCTGLFWIVPAKVEGKWKLLQDQLTLQQSYQMVSGELNSGSNNVPITDGRLTGDKISFKAGSTEYAGIVRGNAMEGTFKSGGNTGTWSGYRIPE